jgi:DNA-binding MarR family transcriptional regulator
LQQAEQLQEFMEEMFELSKELWAAQSRLRGRAQAELTETEFLALDILNKAEHTLNVGDIQRQVGVLPAQMSRIIRSLETKGDQPLISCRINPEDKRKVDVEITTTGRQAHRSYRQMKLGSIERLLLTLSEDDRQEFMRILRLIRSAMSKPQK